MVESQVIQGHVLEYIDDLHMYLVDGVIVPSVTQIMKVRFGGKYTAVPKSVLDKAADAGTKMHAALQKYCETGEDDGSLEVSSFRWMERVENFKPVANEQMIIIPHGDNFYAGRFDLLAERDGKLGICDFKRMAAIDKDYVAYQLNLYRIGYKYSYGNDIEWLAGIQLKGQKRHFYEMPVKEDLAIELMNEYEEQEKQSDGYTDQGPEDSNTEG